MQNGQTHAVGYAVHSRYAACSRYTVGVSAKRSTHTVDLANICGGDCYLECIPTVYLLRTAYLTASIESLLGNSYIT